MDIIEDEYSIKDPIHPQNQNFGYQVLDQAWLGVMNNWFKSVMLQQVRKVWYDKKQHKKTIVFGKKCGPLLEKKEGFVERHIFRGYIVFIEDVSNDSMSMTENVICKIHEESNYQVEFFHKMGEISWEWNVGHIPMLSVSVDSQLKSQPGQLTLPIVFGGMDILGTVPGYLQCQTNAIVLSNKNWWRLIHLLTNKRWLILMQMN